MNEVKAVSAESWKPYNYPGVKTPIYFCRNAFCYACLQPLPFGMVSANTQVVFVFMLCLAAIGVSAWTYDCATTGKTATYAGLLTFVMVPHNTIITWLFGISFERALDYHKMIAYVAVVVGFIHMIICGSNTSGYILIAVMTALILTSFPPIRRNFFETFFKLHWMFFIFTFVLAYTHQSADQMSYGAFFWLGDVVYRYFYLAKTKYPREAQAYALAANVIKISFPKGQFNYRAGQYIFICIPELTRFQWHPFSLSSSPNQDIVSIHIRVLGDWTSQLLDLVKPEGPAGKSIKILMEGPYGEPAIDIDGPKYKNFLLISGGIGITPMQSICNDLLHQYECGRPINKLWFVWSCADKAMVDALIEDPNTRLSEDTSLRNKSRMPTSFSPDELTRVSSSNLTRNSLDLEAAKDKKSHDPFYSEYYLTRVRQTEDHEIANINPTVQECLRFGRPDVKRILTEMKDICIGHGDNRCGVMVCGPESLIDTVRFETSKISGKGVTFDFHAETFHY